MAKLQLIFISFIKNLSIELCQAVSSCVNFSILKRLWVITTMKDQQKLWNTFVLVVLAHNKLFLIANFKLSFPHRCPNFYLSEVQWRWQLESWKLWCKIKWKEKPKETYEYPKLNIPAVHDKAIFIAKLARLIEFPCTTIATSVRLSPTLPPLSWSIRGGSNTCMPIRTRD